MRRWLTNGICVLTFLFLSLLPFNLNLAKAEINAHTSYGWGMKPAKDGRAPNVGFYESILARHNAFYMDKTTTSRIYLTFDSGYENGNTSKILDILKKQRVNATFFLVGDYLRERKDLVKRMVSEGHIIGNHTWKHADLTKVSQKRYENELTKFEDYYKNLTGNELMKIMRPPAGTFSDHSLKVADDLGYYNIFWSLAYKDWVQNEQHGWKYAYDKVMERIHPGAIILMHSVSDDNTEALERIIIDLRKKGYEFEPITTLIMSNMLYVSNS